MSILNKILIAIATILVLGALSFLVYDHFALKAQNAAIQQSLIQFKQLADGIVRSESQFATKDDIAKFAADNKINLQAIQDDMNKLGATVSSINVAKATSQAQVISNVPSTETGETNTNNTPEIPTLNQAEQKLQLNEKFGTLLVPIGEVGFKGWLPSPFSENIPQRTYSIDTVIGITDKRQDIVYNKLTISVAGKDYQIPISSSKTETVYPSAKLTLWNPRILMGLDLGANLNHLQPELSPSISLGIASYGQYLVNPDWSFLEIGASWHAVNGRPALMITPFAWNIGKHFFSPLMENTYIGPSISWASDGTITTSAGIRVGF
jgi:Tfp pilus assembly protein PilE